MVVIKPTLVNSRKLIKIPSCLRAPKAIMQTDPLKGVAAPPRFVPKTSADFSAASFKPENLVSIGTKVRATAALLTTELASPLNHKVTRVALNELFPAS